MSSNLLVCGRSRKHTPVSGVHAGVCPGIKEKMIAQRFTHNFVNSGGHCSLPKPRCFILAPWVLSPQFLGLSHSQKSLFLHRVHCVPYSTVTGRGEAGSRAGLPSGVPVPDAGWSGTAVWNTRQPPPFLGQMVPRAGGELLGTFASWEPGR